MFTTNFILLPAPTGPKKYLAYKESLLKRGSGKGKRKKVEEKNRGKIVRKKERKEIKEKREKNE